MINKQTLIDYLHNEAMNNKNNKSTGGKKKMKNNIFLQVLSIVIMVVVFSFMVQGVIFADEVKVEENLKEYYGNGNSNLPMYRWYDSTLANIKGIEHFRNIPLEVEMNGFAIVDGEDKAYLFLKDATNVFIEVYGVDKARTEKGELMVIVFDKVEGKVAPIYKPNTSYIGSLILKMNKYGSTALELKERYNLPHAVSSVLFGDNSPDGVERDITDLIYIDFLNGVNKETLKEDFGINDDFIKYVIEPRTTLG